MNIIVTGARDWADRDYVFARLDELHAADPITVVIEGEATGADTFARDWAEERGVPFDPHPYIRQLGRAGGPVRNREMLNVLLALPDRHVIAFHPDLEGASRGTKNMVEIARKAGVPVTLFTGA